MRFGLGILGLRVRARARGRLRIYACKECRDGAMHNICNMQKPYNFPTGALKAYSSDQAFYLSAFVISKTYPNSCPKPSGRQLNAKVCGSTESVKRR